MGASPLRVAAAVVWRGDRVLLTRRPPGGPLGLFWEFPGGKIEEGETPYDALVREIREELSVTARPLEVLAFHRHRYAHGLEVEITFVRCELETVEVRPGAGVHEVRWNRPQDLDVGEVLEADRSFLTELAKANR